MHLSFFYSLLATLIVTHLFQVYETFSLFDFAFGTLARASFFTFGSHLRSQVFPPILFQFTVSNVSTRHKRRTPAFLLGGSSFLSAHWVSFLAAGLRCSDLGGIFEQPPQPSDPPWGDRVTVAFNVCGKGV